MVQQVLAQYDLGHAAIVEPLGNAGGFSGCQLWKVRTVVGEFCLRKWPRRFPTLTRLQMIHGVLQHVYRSGCDFVAVPLKARSGETIIQHENDFWEVTEWMQGNANFSEDPSDKRLASAVHALARFHVAASTIDGLNSRRSGSENLEKVITHLGHAESIVAAAEREQRLPTTELSHLLQMMKLHGIKIASSLLPRVQKFMAVDFPAQPVIRDIWHDHVFFTGDEVSGLVDFGAISIDVVSFDLARLLGSLVGEQPPRFQWAIEVYQQSRQLSDSEHELITLLDECGVVIGCGNWLKWLIIEGREFESKEAVCNRIATLGNRLNSMATNFD